MKNLNLNDFGIQEMNAEEMVMIEGGGIWFALAALVGYYYALQVAGNPTAHINAFKAGWNSINYNK